MMLGISNSNESQTGDESCERRVRESLWQNLLRFASLGKEQDNNSGNAQ